MNFFHQYCLAIHAHFNYLIKTNAHLHLSIHLFHSLSLYQKFAIYSNADHYFEIFQIFTASFSINPAACHLCDYYWTYNLWLQA